jgi:hypothetical protein
MSSVTDGPAVRDCAICTGKLAEHAISAEPYTVNAPYYVQALIDNSDEYYWNWSAPVGTGASATYSFNQTLAPWDDPVARPGFLPMSEPQKAMVREIMGQHMEVANIKLTEAADGGDIRLSTWNVRNNIGAYPGVGEGGDIFIDRNLPTSYGVGSDTRRIHLHEVGHALSPTAHGREQLR